MSDVCPCCNRRLPKARAAAPTSDVDVASLSIDALYAHYKATAPREDVAFMLRTAVMSDELRGDVWELFGDIVARPTMARADIYRRLRALQDRWRQESNARETRARQVQADRIARRLARARARMARPAAAADIAATNHGTIITIEALTTAGRDWMADHVPDSSDGAATCDHRCGLDILHGAAADGLRIEDTGRAA